MLSSVWLRCRAAQFTFRRAARRPLAPIDRGDRSRSPEISRLDDQFCSRSTSLCHPNIDVWLPQFLNLSRQKLPPLLIWKAMRRLSHGSVAPAPISISRASRNVGSLWRFVAQARLTCPAIPRLFTGSSRGRVLNETQLYHSKWASTFSICMSPLIVRADF